MFTGIIEQVGTVASASAAGKARALRIDAPALSPSLRPGDSVAVNGVCLTVERADERGFHATAVRETLERTTLGAIEAGDGVNLERAATAERFLGGHIVQGHIDGVGRVRAFAAVDAGDRTLELEVPDDIHELCVDKGAIAVDGVSLTIARKLADGRITIAIVPHTFTHTIVAAYQPGRRVNIESDVVARYVREYVRRYQSTAPR